MTVKTKNSMFTKDQVTVLRNIFKNYTTEKIQQDLALKTGPKNKNFDYLLKREVGVLNAVIQDAQKLLMQDDVFASVRKSLKK